MNLSLADEHVGDVTIPTQVIEYNQNQIKLLANIYKTPKMVIKRVSGTLRIERLESQINKVLGEIKQMLKQHSQFRLRSLIPAGGIPYFFINNYII